MLSSTQSHLLALIRFSLGGELESLLTDGSIDWYAVYEEAKRQSVIGIAYAGVERLSELDPTPPGQWTTESLQADAPKPTANAIKPPMLLLLDWMGEAKQCRKRNILLNSRSSELTEYFAKEGFRSVILKGQSNAYLYSSISKDIDLGMLRSPGDIDIWLEGKRKDIIQYLLENGNVKHFQLHHADFNIIDKTEVEVHFRPTLLYNPITNYRLQKFFLLEAEQSFGNWATVGNEGVYEPRFCRLCFKSDVVMQLVHLYRHVLFEGIGIRQIIDLYVLITSWGAVCDAETWENTKVQVRKQIKALGIQRFAGALMYVLTTIFHLDKKYLLADINTKEGEYLMKEIFIGGNFGHYDTRYVERGGSAFRNFMVITRKNMRMFTHYPSDCIWYTFYRIYQFVWRIINKYS